MGISVPSKMRVVGVQPVSLTYSKRSEYEVVVRKKKLGARKGVKRYKRYTMRGITLKHRSPGRTHTPLPSLAPATPR